MAKILRTEQLSVDGDNIRLTANQGNLIINSVSGDDLVQITSTTKIGQDISSLAVRDTEFDTDVSSLAAKNSEAENLAITASKYGAYGLKTSNLSTGTGSSVQTITLSGRAFISEPVVTASLLGGANDPIIAVMVSDVSETATSGVYQATFQFSDELPATGETDQSTSYKLNIVACVSGTDADLDTIIDSMDSDRDGDGVENSLDSDPDDASIGATSPTDYEYDSYTYMWKVFGNAINIEWNEVEYDQFTVDDADSYEGPVTMSDGKIFQRGAYQESSINGRHDFYSIRLNNP